MDRYAELKDMPFDDLAAVVSEYPWFGAARKFLCEKMARMGGNEWGISQYADAAMHIACRSRISSLLRKGYTYSYNDVAEIIGKYLSAGTLSRSAGGLSSGFRGVGDYFSQDQYARVRQSGDDSFGRFAAGGGDAFAVEDMEFDMDFCTETLAQIYAEQGYYQQAKEIYSKLILAYPEENAYFAALIEKLNV